jgi:hypothetical protein
LHPVGQRRKPATAPITVLAGGRPRPAWVSAADVGPGAADDELARQASVRHGQRKRQDARGRSLLFGRRVMGITFTLGLAPLSAGRSFVLPADALG